MDDLTQLALAARGGDDTAFAALVRRLQPDVWRLAAHLTGEHRADDLTQEVFVQVWRALPRYRAEAGVRTWALAITRHVAVDALRAAARRPVAVAGDHDASVADHAGVVTAAALFDHLSPERRTALFLTQILGLSYAEAAEVAGVPVGTIRSRVARGREDLVAELDEGTG